MPLIKVLAVLPFLGILVGVPLLNRVTPLVLGMPLILAWIVLWIILTGVIMAIIYLLDPANRDTPNSIGPNSVEPNSIGSSNIGPGSRR